MPASEDEGCLGGVYIHYSGVGHLHIEMKHLNFLIVLGKNDDVAGEAFSAAVNRYLG